LRIRLSVAAVAVVLVAVLPAGPIAAATPAASDGPAPALAGFQPVVSAASSLTGGPGSPSTSVSAAVASGSRPRHALALTRSPVAATAPPSARQRPQGAASPADLQSNGGFAGLGYCTLGATCTEPPDPWVAVSASDVVQAVNLAIRVSTRAGATLRTTAFPTFFAELGSQQGDSDPHVVWDAPHGRWLATELSWDCAAGHLYLAVSSGADPAGTWRSYRFDFPGQLPDYPDVGKSSDKVAVSFNLFNLDKTAPQCSGNTFQGGQMYVVDWSALTSGATSIPVAATVASLGTFAWRPANSLTPGAPLYAAVELGNGDVGYGVLTGTVKAGTLVLTGPSDLTSGLALPAFADPPEPRQPGSPSTIADAVDSRPTDALWQAGHLWFVSTAPCVPAGDTITRDCVRVTEVNTTASPSVRQDFVLGADGVDDFMGGIGLSATGTLFVVYSQSSGGAFASTLAVAQASTDAIDTTRAPIVVKAGQSTYRGARWGDYVGVPQDPAQADTVWQADEYANASGTWSTWISNLTFDTTPPAGTFTVAAGAAATATPTVAITDTATDTLTGVSQMRIANDGATWDAMPYATTLSWDVTNAAFGGTSGDGVKTVTMEWQDGAGNWSGPTSHAIVLDRIPPVGSLSINGGAAAAHSITVSLSLNATDAGSGVASARIANDPSMTSAISLSCPGGVCSTPFTLPAGNGPKTVYATFTDKAGNTSSPTSASIVLAIPIRLDDATYADLSGYPNDRYGTDAAVAEQAFPAGASIVYVASGANFPDALGAGAAAGKAGGPVLLVTPTSIPAAIAHELTALHPATIYVVGGTASVSDAVMTSLETYATTVTRLDRTTYPDLSGYPNDRYGTDAAVVEQAFPGGAPTVYVASGANFPDALGAGAAAIKAGGPVLLVTPTSIPPAIALELTALHPSTINVVGGSASVSDAVMTTLGSYAATVKRLDVATYPDLSGYPNDRYGTDATVAEQAFGGSATTVYIASGADFPDALGAGAAAGVADGPVLLVTPTSVPAAIAHELSVLKPTTVYIVGGAASVSDAVAAAVAAYMGP
jgi:putative cell wall-binding protein